jgi:hypothetical protein
LECLRHARVYDSAASSSCSPTAHESVLPSSYLNRIGTRLGTASFNDYWGAQWLACTNLHFERSRQRCCHLRPSEEGRSRWLVVLRKKLSFSIPRRFIPAHSGLVFGVHARWGSDFEICFFSHRPPRRSVLVAAAIRQVPPGTRSHPTAVPQTETGWARSRPAPSPRARRVPAWNWGRPMTPDDRRRAGVPILRTFSRHREGNHRTKRPGTLGTHSVALTQAHSLYSSAAICRVEA